MLNPPLAVLAVALSLALSACATSTYVEWPLKVGKSPPQLVPGQPRIRSTPGLTQPIQEWWTAAGEELGLLDQGPRQFRYPSYYEGVTYVFGQWRTTAGHYVAEGLGQRTTWLITIVQPGRADSLRWELYGPTLKSVRAARWVEDLKTKDGGDIWYFTREGTFKASELGP